MKVKYKGFELEAKREKCLAGYLLLYYSATRIEDGWIMINNFSDCADTIRDYISYLKENIDDYYENPEDCEDDF